MVTQLGVPCGNEEGAAAPPSALARPSAATGCSSTCAVPCCRLHPAVHPSHGALLYPIGRMCLKSAYLRLRSKGGVQGDLFTDLVELWKRMDLPEDSSDHVSQEQYDTQIQEMLISPLRQHHIGCVMAFLSAHELFANSIRSEMGNVVKLSAAPQSRLSFHLQARLLSHLQALLSPCPREPLRSVSQRLARPLVSECSTKRHICA